MKIVDKIVHSLASLKRKKDTGELFIPPHSLRSDNSTPDLCVNDRLLLLDFFKKIFDCLHLCGRIESYQEKMN